MSRTALAWRSLWRNRRRTLITLCAMSLSLMLVQAFHNLSSGVYSRMIDSGVRAGTGHIALYREGYPEARSEALLFDPQDLPKRLRKQPGVEAALPRLYLPALAQSSRESRGVLMLGVDARFEPAVNPYLKDLPEDALLRPGQPRDAVLGQRLMEELRLKEGQKFVVSLQNRSSELASELFRVRGRMKTGIPEVDAGTLMVNLESAARLSGSSEGIHELALVLDGESRLKTMLPVVRHLARELPGVEVLDWEQAMPNLANAIRLDNASQKFIFAIILAIVGIGVVNSLLMSVMERIREFGLILALGTSPRHLRCLVLLEAGLLGLLSALLGSALGALATWYLVVRGIDLRAFISESIEVGGVVFEPVLRATWDLPAMAASALFMVLLCLAAGLYPARKAARTPPAEAMRHV